ncbi:hypothetical protein niasHT_035581 [Heterodera trifolii]|uniref:Uncharacterized protein n=1 Tax=Heterodera trifolii TaxID=157864 RepID=A0ABD2IBR0_9BILA
MFYTPSPQSHFDSRESSANSFSSSRRSSRIASRQPSRGSSVIDESTTISFNPLTQRCYQKHKGLPCADVRAKHYQSYYDSGNLGDKKCDFCKALLFSSEATAKHGKTSSAICCNFGKICLPKLSDPPAELSALSSENSAEAKEFRKNQNAYNSLLAFASVSVGYKENSVGGDVCFMLNGLFVRRISSIFSGQMAPNFAQLFVLDPEQALEHRKQNTRYGGDRVNPNTLKKLDAILRQHHPLAKQLMNFHQQYQSKLAEGGPDAVHNFRLTLLEARMAPAGIRDPNLHPRQTNLPTEGTLFAVWTESDRPPMEKGIWITTGQGELKQFPPYHPSTDTLCYPLVFHAETMDITKTCIKALCISRIGATNKERKKHYWILMLMLNQIMNRQTTWKASQTGPAWLRTKAMEKERLAEKCL